MTKETRTFIELADILAFQFRCKKCGATITRPISGVRNAPGGTCPNCLIDWADGLDETHLAETVEDLASKIRYLKTIIGKKNFTLQIEVTPEEEKK